MNKKPRSKFLQNPNAVMLQAQKAENKERVSIRMLQELARLSNEANVIRSNRNWRSRNKKRNADLDKLVYSIKFLADCL